MKSILGMTALAALMMSAAVATVQADEVNGPWPRDGAQLLLAEGGSDRLADFFLRREVLVSERQGQGCGFHGHLATHSMSIWPPIPR